MKKKILALVLALVMILSLCAACGGDKPVESKPVESKPADSGNAELEKTADPVKLVFSASSSTGMATTDLMKWFADEVGVRTEGRVTVEFYPDGQLYKSGESPMACLTGAIDIMCDGTAGGWPDYVPIFNLTELFFVLPGSEFIEENVDELREVLFPLWEEEIGVKPLALMSRGTGGILTNKLVEKPEDLAGLQMRGPNEPDWLCMDLLGVTPIQMSASEQYDAMSKGTLDGSRATYQSFSKNDLGEHCPYLYMDVLHTIFGLVVNMDAWNKVGSYDQAIIEEIAREFEAKSFPIVREEEAVYLKDLEDTGVKFFKPSEADVEAFREVLTPFYKDMVQKCLDAGFEEETRAYLEVVGMEYLMD